MGIGGTSFWQLLIILAVVVLIFGSGSLKSLGSDLGSSLKGFKKAIKEEDWDTAADEMLDSKWAKQTPERANELSSIIRSCKL